MFVGTSAGSSYQITTHRNAGLHSFHYRHLCLELIVFNQFIGQQTNCWRVNLVFTEQPHRNPGKDTGLGTTSNFSLNQIPSFSISFSLVHRDMHGQILCPLMTAVRKLVFQFYYEFD